MADADQVGGVFVLTMMMAPASTVTRPRTKNRLNRGGRGPPSTRAMNSIDPHLLFFWSSYGR